jgi:hypothetical protein
MSRPRGTALGKALGKASRRGRAMNGTVGITAPKNLTINHVLLPGGWEILGSFHGFPNMLFRETPDISAFAARVSVRKTT